MTTLAPAFSIRLAATLLAVCGLGACTVLPAEPMKHSEGFTRFTPCPKSKPLRPPGRFTTAV